MIEEDEKDTVVFTEQSEAFWSVCLVKYFFFVKKDIHKFINLRICHLTLRFTSERYYSPFGCKIYIKKIKAATKMFTSYQKITEKNLRPIQFKFRDLNL